MSTAGSNEIYVDPNGQMMVRSVCSNTDYLRKIVQHFFDQSDVKHIDDNIAQYRMLFHCPHCCSRQMNESAHAPAVRFFSDVHLGSNNLLKLSCTRCNTIWVVCKVCHKIIAVKMYQSQNRHFLQRVQQHDVLQCERYVRVNRDVANIDWNSQQMDKEGIDTEYVLCI